MSAWLVAFCASTLLTLATQVPSRDDDVERALAEARTRATAGNVVAQFSLGAMHYYGDKDTAQGIEWFRKAAAQAYAPAEFQMGQLYDFGFGVAQDDGTALEWYSRAAEHGSAAAQRAVGDFYRKGRGIPADLAKAAAWYRRGADGDDVRAQNQLGEMYFTGTGVPLDYASAYFWYSVAAGQAPLLDNRKGLLELRNIAAARMTPEQLAQAERRVAEWKPPAHR